MKPEVSVPTTNTPEDVATETNNENKPENKPELKNQSNTEQPNVTSAEEEKPKSPIERIINGINNQISNMSFSSLLNGKKKEEPEVPVIESSIPDPKLMKINNTGTVAQPHLRFYQGPTKLLLQLQYTR